MLKLTACLAAFTALILAAPAAAATRYTAPSGSGSTCSNASPCGFETAVENAANGDEIVVKPGSYTVNAKVDANGKSNLEIHGQAGQARPTVTIAAPMNGASLLVGTLAHVHDLDLVCTGASTSCVFAAPLLTLENATVTNSGTGSTGVYASSTAGSGTTVVRNAIVRATGTAVSLNAANAQVSSATLVAPNGGTALYVAGGVAGRVVTVRNTIAESGSTDIFVSSSDSTADVDYSQYGTVGTSNGGHTTIGAHNVHLAPAFVSATDAHVTATSAGIDAGLANFLTPSTDIDGDPRPLGAAIDMGADEFRTPPTAVTGAASSVAETGATLNGTVNAQNNTTVVWTFEYGTTTAYGSTTGMGGPANGGTTEAVSRAIAGLAAGTTYHVRLVASSGYGDTGYGADMTFTTAAAPSPGDPPPSDPGAGSTTPPSSSDVPPANTTPPAQQELEQQVVPAPVTTCRVPKLRGLSRARAGKKLERAGCRVGRVRGRGRVVRQSRKAGTMLAAGARVGLRLRPR